MEEASDAVLREKSLEYYRGLRTIACDPDSEHADLKLLKQKIMAIQRVFVRRKALAASAKRGIPMPTKEPGSPSSKRRKVRVGRMDRSPSLFKDKTCIETALKRKPYLLKIPHCIEVDRRLAGGMSNSELNNQGGESKVSQLQKLVTPFRKKDLFDVWTRHEIDVFEASICSLGKDFYNISKLIKTKTVNEVVEFYYKIWKKSTNYQVWKCTSEHFKDDQRVDQMLLHQQKMTDF